MAPGAFCYIVKLLPLYIHQNSLLWRLLVVCLLWLPLREIHEEMPSVLSVTVWYRTVYRSIVKLSRLLISNEIPPFTVIFSVHFINNEEDYEIAPLLFWSPSLNIHFNCLHTLEHTENQASNVSVTDIIVRQILYQSCENNVSVCLWGAAVVIVITEHALL